ncbi:MAG TPA: LuxR C-terminal-related transcriptional regulator [Opitutaceae bacterium]|jgi:DNA-binding CsgD family transcriptional regulator|nr:LuxR C-terminal-related transcriptional regulator [Opitutaceae bacterium]
MADSVARAISERDVRAMVRLLGEVPGTGGGQAAQKRCLMQGLARLIGANCWIWGYCASLVPGKQPVYIGGIHGGFDNLRFARFMAAVDHPEMAALTGPFAAELARSETHLTRLGHEIVDQEAFVRSEAGRLWHEAGIGSIILSYRPLPEEGRLSAAGLYRPTGRPLFTAREARIAHIVLSEVPWLHQLGWPTERGPAVPALGRRARTVLNLLLQGMSRKEIAAGFRIAEETVNSHVKAVFRHFGVRARADLIHRFFRGDGGDRPRRFAGSGAA